MFGLSLPEIIFLAILALVVIGPKQLPEVARTLGRVLNELRRASSSLTEEFRQHVKIDPIRLEDPKPQPPETPHAPMPLQADQVFDNGTTEASAQTDDSKNSEVKKS
ncbi:twin-arginine translocase TatA/TatE family subunit [Bdellovibrio sp. HCB337]|uniref:Sec-independent protein translocase subunit TatA/TatB n=1 Tax=Bdellovibrio sp. HCB337 TaxID=3394358 RepID=UPI0039A4BDF6